MSKLVDLVASERRPRKQQRVAEEETSPTSVAEAIETKDVVEEHSQKTAQVEAKETGDSDAAKQDVAPASDVPPSKPLRDYDRLIRAGGRASRRGRISQAMSYYEKALSARPEGVEALTGLAYCDLDLQRYSSALNGFHRALAISPRFEEAMIGLAETYKIMGNKTKALDTFRAYLRAHPTGSHVALAGTNVISLTRELERVQAQAQQRAQSTRRDADEGETPRVSTPNS